MEKKIKKEFIESCQQELGYISGIFMSQGNTRAKDIIMPTTELQEAIDRIELYLFKALSSQRQAIIKKIEKQNIDFYITAKELKKVNENLRIISQMAEEGEEPIAIRVRGKISHQDFIDRINKSPN